MIRVLLAGNAVTAEILLSYLQRDTRYEVVGCTVDDEFVGTGSVSGVRAVGLSQVIKLYPPANHRVIMAAGYGDLNRARAGLFNRLKSLGYVIETYIHPDARVISDEAIGDGSIVLPGAVIEPHVRVGANTMIWANVTLSHHCSVADHCWIAAGSVVSGQARVLNNSFLGVNSTVVNAVTVEEYNIVGAGALITRNTKRGSVHIARSAELVRFSSDDYVKHFGI